MVLRHRGRRHDDHEERDLVERLCDFFAPDAAFHLAAVVPDVNLRLLGFEAAAPGVAEASPSLRAYEMKTRGTASDGATRDSIYSGKLSCRRNKIRADTFLFRQRPVCGTPTGRR